MEEEFIKEHWLKILSVVIILILTIMLFGTYLEKNKLRQFSEIVQQEKFRYKKRIQHLEKERDALCAKLEPFIARADYGFPDAPPEDRLKLLIMKMDETNLKLEAENRAIAADRVISAENKFYITNSLKHIPKLNLEITYPADDPESCRLANQIKGIFDAAGWDTKSFYPTKFATPVHKMVVEFGDNPSNLLQKALLPLFDSLGYTREAFLNIDLPKDRMKIIVGHA